MATTPGPGSCIPWMAVNRALEPIASFAKRRAPRRPERGRTRRIVEVGPAPDCQVSLDKRRARDFDARAGVRVGRCGFGLGTPTKRSWQRRPTPGDSAPRGLGARSRPHLGVCHLLIRSEQSPAASSKLALGQTDGGVMGKAAVPPQGNRGPSVSRRSSLPCCRPKEKPRHEAGAFHQISEQIRMTARFSSG